MKTEFKYEPLPEPIPITEQVWPEGTVPLVHTRTMTFMHEDYIRDCIEGILMQKTTFPVQVLIHDDASTDKTAEIVKEYEQKFPALIKAYYQKENSYTKIDKYSRREEFISWRIGKYEATCEGDDYWTDPLKLQLQVSILEQNTKYVFCCHRFKRFVQSENLYYDDDKSEWYNKKQLEIDVSVLFREWPASTLTMLIRTDALLNVTQRVKGYKHSMDVHLFYLLLTEGKGIAIDRYMAVYRLHSGGVSGGLDQRSFTIKAYLVHKELYFAHKNEEAIRKKFFMYLLILQRNLVESKLEKFRRFKEGLSLYKGTVEFLRLLKNTLMGMLTLSKHQLS